MVAPPGIDPLQGERRQRRGQRDHDQQRGIKLGIQDSIREPDLREYQADLAAGNHAQADHGLAQASLADAVAGESLPRDRDDEQCGPQLPHERRAPVYGAQVERHAHHDEEDRREDVD